MDLHLKHNGKLTNLVSRIEHHGEDKVNAVTLDIEINDIPAGELDQFALDGNMLSTTLWESESDKDLAGGYKLGSPKLALLKTPLAIDMEYEKHKVVIAMESADKLIGDVGAVTILDATIKGVKFTPKNHGVADLSLKINGELEGMEQGKVIAKYLQERISLVIQPGDESQQSLLDDDQAEQGPESAHHAEAATG